VCGARDKVARFFITYMQPTCKLVSLFLLEKRIGGCVSTSLLGATASGQAALCLCAAHHRPSLHGQQQAFRAMFACECCGRETFGCCPELSMRRCTAAARCWALWTRGSTPPSSTTAKRLAATRAGVLQPNPGAVVAPPAKHGLNQARL
jgi:hypothetical protein